MRLELGGPVGDGQEADVRSTRPLHRRPAALGAVAVGGLFGAAAREAIEQALPTGSGRFPVATLLINLGGALLLGGLLEGLSRAGDDTGARRTGRLLAGTGFLGAFTTYSTFAVESDLLIRASRPALAAFYIAATALGGLFAVILGVALAARQRRWGGAGLPVDPDLDDDEDDEDDSDDSDHSDHSEEDA